MRLSAEKRILTRFAKLIFAALCGLARRGGARKSKFLFPRKTRLCYAAEAFHSASRHKKSRALMKSARQYFISFYAASFSLSISFCTSCKAHIPFFNSTPLSEEVYSSSSIFALIASIFFCNSALFSAVTAT